jgi:hypothetical protein
MAYTQRFIADTAEEAERSAREWASRLDYMCQPYVRPPQWTINDKGERVFECIVEYWGLD